MNEYERQPETANRSPVEKSPAEAYPSAVESLSGKWRDIQSPETPNAVTAQTKRNTTALGIGIGLAIVIFLALVGGFLLLVWTVNR